VGAEILTYSVSHHTRLRYSELVARSFNEARMRPRNRATQTSLTFSLLTSPTVMPRSRIDYFGNYVHRIDVGVPHRTLDIAVEAVVQSKAAPAPSVAPVWDEDVLGRDPLLEFALPSPRVPSGGAPAVLWREWSGGDRSLSALLACANRIKDTFQYVAGATTVDSGIDELLRGGAGVCQDFTHLFIAMARSAGWPARYVSGYVGPVGDESSVQGASHAWADVCSGDGRWIGIDPTHGGRTGPQHLCLAVGRDYADVAPHRGLYFGDALSDLPEVTVRVSRISPEVAIVVERGATMQWQQQQQQ
jgi:transglutaminase-like putative cysteine protease